MLSKQIVVINNGKWSHFDHIGPVELVTGPPSVKYEEAEQDFGFNTLITLYFYRNIRTMRRFVEREFVRLPISA